jgi:hypothetical protein
MKSPNIGCNPFLRTLVAGLWQSIAFVAKNALIIVIVTIIAFSSTAIFNVNYATAQGLFQSYIDGMEEARRQNWRDMEYYNRMERLRLINQAIHNYTVTGNLDYLCVAVALGDVQTARILANNGIGCRF